MQRCAGALLVSVADVVEAAPRYFKPTAELFDRGTVRCERIEIDDLASGFWGQGFRHDLNCEQPRTMPVVKV